MSGAGAPLEEVRDAQNWSHHNDYGPQTKIAVVAMVFCFETTEKGIFSYTPEPHVGFCPIFVHPLFPVFEPHTPKWVIFVRRRPCVCDTFRFESPPLRGKKIELLPPPPSRGLRQLNFPNVKNDAGQKQYSPCFLRRRRGPKAGDAFTRTRLMPTFGVSAALSVEQCRT